MEVIFAAVIAALAALGGVWLEKRSNKSTAEAQWKHEADARRRQHGEQVAREVRRELLAAASQLSSESGAERAGARNRWDPPSDATLKVHTDKARDLEIEIPQKDVREFIKLAAYALDEADTANQWGADEPWQTSRKVASEVDAVIGAYISGDDIPDFPTVRLVNEVVDDYWKTLDAAQEEYRQEWLAKRNAKRAADLAAAEAKRQRPPEPST